MTGCLGKTMSFNPDEELERFAIQFLEQHGAVLERRAGVIETLMPKELARLLGTKEHTVLRYDPQYVGEGGVSLSYGSVFLEKMLATFCAQVPLATCRLEFAYLKNQGFERQIKENFRFHKALCSVDSSAPVRTDYLLISICYTAQSDEQVQSLMDVAFSLETGVQIPGMPEKLTQADRHFGGSRIPPLGPAATGELSKAVQRWMSDAIHVELRNFKERMMRRYSRDATNLEEYYAALKAEMTRSLERPGLSEQAQQERKEKIALLPEELQRKKDDLRNKYAIRVKATPAAAMLLRTPAVRLLCRLSVGRRRKDFSLTYNPVTKAIDPLTCRACGRGITSVFFSESLEPRCENCRSN